MGGDDWSFLDEEVARLERKGGKGGKGEGRRRRGGGGGGGGKRDATNEGRDAPFDEWSALDAELARIEGKGRSGRGETPARETHRREPPPPAHSHPPRQQREQREHQERQQQQQQQQQQQLRRQSPPPPPAPKADDDEDPATRAAKMAERAARFANDASTRAEHAASNAASLKSRLGPPTPAPSNAKPNRNRGDQEHGACAAAKATGADAVTEDTRRHAGPQLLVGTCESMCPDAERVDRERNGEIELFERVDPASPSCSSAQLCVKKFTRVVDNPSPSSIRTRTALDKTCAHLYGLLGGRCDYPDGEVSLLRRSNFLWDRLRSVRQDMGLQGLTAGGWAAARLEEMARFAIAAEYLLCENVATIHEPDGHNSHLHIEQLGKTLTTLAAVYADEGKNGEKESFPNRAEMTCYSLLLRMDDHGPFRNSASTFLAVLRAAPSDVQRSPEVQFALDARRAYAAVNAPAFFALVRSKRCSYLQACLLHKYFDALRYKALELANCVMNKSPLPMDAVAAEVLFEDSAAHAAEKCEACGLLVEREGESLWLRVKEAAFAEPGVEKAARRRRERWVERKAPAIKSANMFRWQALITGKVGR